MSGPWTDPSASEEERIPVLVAARRTPITRARGSLRALRSHELLAPVLTAVVGDCGEDPSSVNDVVIGNAAGGGGNVARLAALTAELPQTVPGLTIDRQCGSGLDAVVLAARLIAGGAGDFFLAGGVESISTAPARAHRRADGSLDFYERAQHAPEESGDPEMGVAAENVASRYGISRTRQDDFALRSHRLAAQAAKEGLFDAEMVPLRIQDVLVARDEGPRRQLTAGLLARFPAAFVEGGTVTAGNSCGFSDGAAVVAVMSLAAAKRRGIPAGLHFVDSATAGVDPLFLGVGAAASTRDLVARVSPDDAVPDLIEFNEAFAAQVLASLDLLGIDPDTVNREGGALALGHPYGASGAVSVTRLFHQARRIGRDGTKALAMISIAGGLGTSALFRWRRF